MLAHEVMTAPVVALRPTSSVRQAIRLLYQRNITAAPVLDGTGRLVGIVSEMDLLREEFEADPRACERQVTMLDGSPPPRLVEEVMTSTVMTALERSDVADVAELMMSTGVKSVPVVRDGRVVGIISRRDLMGVLARADERIRADVEVTLSDFLPETAGWEILVRDGIVELPAAAARNAAHLADVVTRTVPGVVRVTHRMPD